MNKKTFRVGDKVEWESQAQGYCKVKTGVIVAIVHQGLLPTNACPLKYETNRFSMSQPRDHRSYLIKVGNSYNLNWPRVCHLRKIN